jgi:tetratricopeptide (TPR) repeat protein
MLIQDFFPVEKSVIWQLLQDFYARRGPEVWADGSVPQGSTSNACIADAYATIVLDWLRDLGPQPADKRPLILEIGGGSGRFAWQFMQRLTKRHWLPEDDELAFTYLLTDAAESNLQAWQAEPRFASLKQQGLMDFGRMLVNDDPQIHCVGGLLTLADLQHRPVVIIANYLFDSIPNDLYRVRDGKLQKVLMSLSSEDPAMAAGKPETFETVKPSFKGVDMAQADTGLPLLDSIVNSYRAYDTNMAIPVPRLAFQFLQHFVDRPAPLLLLASDLAYTDPRSFPNSPPFLFNTYFSQFTNFHAFAELFRHHGGGAQFQRSPDPSFTAAAFWTSGRGACLPFKGLRAAVRSQLAEFAPYHAIELMDLLEESSTAATYSQLFAWLRFARMDPQVAQTCLPMFIENYHRSDEGLDKRMLRDAYMEAYEQYLPNRMADRFDYELAQLLLALRFDSDAIQLLEGSLADLGRSPERLYVYALGLLRLERKEDAKRALLEALEQRGDFAAAQQVLDEHFGQGRKVVADELAHITVSCRDPEVATKCHNMMHEHGVVLFQDMFPTAYIDQVRETFLQRYEDWKADDMGRPNSVGNKRFTVPLRMTAPFTDLSLFANRTLLDMIEQQMGEPPIICAYGGVITYPGANSQHVHREHPLLFNDDRYNAHLPMYAANLLIPLTDMDEQLGGTQVWEGTHRYGAEDKWKGPSKVIYARKGDAIALDYRTYHGGMQCLAGDLRPLLFISYSLPWFRDTLAFDLHDAVAISPSELAAVPLPYRNFFRFARRIPDRHAPAAAPQVQMKVSLVAA